MTEGVYDKRKCEILAQINVFSRFRIWAMLPPAHNLLSHILEKNEVPDTLNDFLVKSDRYDIRLCMEKVTEEVKFLS